MLIIGFSLITIFCLLSLCVFVKSDPGLERNFKGHKDSVTCVDINCNMKQIGTYTCIFFTLTCFLSHIYVPLLKKYMKRGTMVTLLLWTPFSHGLQGLVCDGLEHEASDEVVPPGGTQRRRHLRPLLSFGSPGGLCLQRQDCTALGSQSVSITLKQLRLAAS